eukprot:CAMPEP_0203728934 /NCGR_PEP_ID=MMETSP0092-20131115/15321_1 /ASSEMBLY_ACC=CAM_ASM_001090 /TAXON_ID=426623 /ORGANISM="Chaetoceros affinis, Strain CCMP159" /LENGTH=54 /DNA_ID=CAMNT_0050611149 /DNA_START=371 /DNA_END=535 /DNA_ORIENTATION=-
MASSILSILVFIFSQQAWPEVGEDTGAKVDITGDSVGATGAGVGQLLQVTGQMA